MVEQWKRIEINGEIYDNYEVSDWGNVRSLNYYGKTGKTKILKQNKNKDGYLLISLSKNGKCKKFLVHRLVATMFIPNPENKPTVNHINENKEDNRVENLEWATMKEQVNYGTRTQRVSKRVRCVETGEIFGSTHDVERKLGLPQGNICKCCQGKKRYKTVGGFHWEYVD